MEQIRCDVCLDLTYDLFNSEKKPRIQQRQLRSGRFKAIKFSDLRRASSAGCQNCTILKRGATLFWGTRPEGGDTPGDAERRLLVLESHKGLPLIASRAPEDDTGDIKFDHSSIEFFGTESSDILELLNLPHG